MSMLERYLNFIGYRMKVKVWCVRLWASLIYRRAQLLCRAMHNYFCNHKTGSGTSPLYSTKTALALWRLVRSGGTGINSSERRNRQLRDCTIIMTNDTNSFRHVNAKVMLHGWQRQHHPILRSVTKRKAVRTPVFYFETIASCPSYRNA